MLLLKYAFNLLPKSLMCVLCLFFLNGQKAFSQYWLSPGESISLYTGEYAELVVNAPVSGAIIDSYAFTNTNGYIEIHGDNAIVNGYFTGTATITCTYTYHYYVGTTKYTQTNQKAYYYISAKPINIYLNKSNLSLGPNETFQLSYTVQQSDAPSPEIKWESNNEIVASVENGIVRAKTPGTAIITAKNNAGPNAICNVTVEQIEPTSVKLPANETVEVKQTITLTPVLEPANAQSDYNWESSDNTIATVDNGVVTGIKEGTATIKVTTDNNLSASCEIEVIPEKLILTSNHESGVIGIGTKVSINASIPDAQIYYTIDGKVPTQESTLYTEPIIISHSLTLKAKAFLYGYRESEILTREFIVTTLPAKTIYPEEGMQVASGHIIPTISFYEKIVEGESFNNICLKRDNAVIEGSPIIMENTLYFVPEDALVEDSYQLFIPSEALNSSLSEKSHNEAIQIGFSIGKTIPGNLTPRISTKNHSLVVKTDGSLWAWGDNSYGQIGDGTTTKQLSPVKVLDNVADVATGQAHSMAIKTDGSLWTWGDNGNGELGDGTTTKRLSPIKVLDNVVAIAAGQCYSMAIKNDGSLWTWGYNRYGQLGDGTKTNRANPVKVLDGVSSIATNRFHSMALKEDGSLWTWGHNQFGKLGDGTTTDSSLPIKVLDNVVAISAGYDFSMAVKADGSLWAWGYNRYGQLGDGTTTDRSTPVKVLTNVKAISAGIMHSMAVKNDGSLWTWGYNSDGELGDGTTTERHSPRKIMNNVCSIAAGDSRSMAIKEDGSLWEWGIIKYHITIKVVQGHVIYTSETSKTPVMLYESMDDVIELPKLTDMSINERTFVSKGRQVFIYPQFEPTDADYETMEWSSSDETIATVSRRGIVTGVTSGETTITVKITLKDGTEFTAESVVNVYENVVPVHDITFDENSDNADVLNADADVNVRVKRTIKADEWSTICLPFAMTESQVKEAFGDDVELADFDGIESTYDGNNVTGIRIKFNTVNAIDANHPYIIKVSTPITEFTVSAVDITPSVELSVHKDEQKVKDGSIWLTSYNSFVGTFVADTNVPENCLFLNDNKFWYSTGKTKMKAFRAYFEFLDILTEVQEAEVKIFIAFDDEEDGIGEMVNSKVSNSNCYDLSGRKVAKPQQHGVYIINGKKILK